MQLSARGRTVRTANLIAWVVLAAAAVRTGDAHAQSAPPEAGADAPAPPAESEYVVRASEETAGYADSDHVFVLTPSVTGHVGKPTAGWSVDASYLVDVISAASVDIVSTASQRWQEVRQGGAVSGAWQRESFGVSASGVVSYEPDYLSLAGGILLTQDLLEKNLTLLVGYDHGHDVAGRTGTPFSVYSHAIDLNEVKAGLSLVLDRATIGTALLEANFVDGDTSKPYRYIPLFAPGTQVRPGASIDSVNATRLSARVLEQVPLTRNRYALTARVAHRFHASTLRVEERLYDDTWGLAASTTDARWIADVSRRVELGPHVRFHAQTAVDFWQLAYVLRSGLDFPAYRTGDRELGPLVNVTAGATLRVAVGPARAPETWTLGLDLGATYSRYFDDLYITGRLSSLGALSVAGEL